MNRIPHFPVRRSATLSPANPPHRFPRCRGAALVIILALIVLLLGLSVTFLTRARVERGASSSFLASATTRQLADVAVNLVQGQIRDATTQGRSVAWVSQPGMIRTFGTSSGAGLEKVYKLYSADELIAGTYHRDGDLPPATWANDKAVWTDLNAPVMVRNPDGDTPERVPQFPILDPRAIGTVEGFGVTSPPAGSVTSGNAEDLRLPMPVKWLYVLQDGKIVAPSGSGANATVAGATQDNPITGRIAFWTDDETCKVNINTASEGTSWDTPRANSAEDWKFADKQPVQKEFQRYPGHPAMTSLSPVLFATSATETPPLTKAQRDAIYSIVPRVVGGGSDAGTVTVASTASTLEPDTDRLYATVDEMIYASDRSAQASAAGLTREKLEAARFFLTASSRAPEVTLFNSPRVAVWPIIKDHLTTNPDRATAYDRLIAFCSTINGQPYFFQRENSRSPTSDWENIPSNKELLRYLRALSDLDVPGFGQDLGSKIGSDNRDQLLVEMMDYIRSTNLFDDNLSPIAFASQSAADGAKQFTSGRRISTAPTDPGFVWKGHGVAAPLSVPQNLADTYPSLEPDATSLMGFGRFATITEAGIHFICCADGSAGTTAAPINSAPADPNAGAKRISNDLTNRTLSASLTQQERRIQAMLMFDFYSPMQGWTSFGEDLNLEVEVPGGDWKINNISLGFPSTMSADFVSNPGFGHHPSGGHIGPRAGLFSRYVSGARPPLAADSSPANTTIHTFLPYNLVGVPITITVPAGSNPTMQFSGGTLRAKLSYRGGLVQTIDLDFPAADFPVPELKVTGTPGYPTGPFTPATDMRYWWAFQRDGAFAGNGGRLANVDLRPHSDAGNIIWPEDTLRTIIPYHGDFRLIAGSHYVPPGVFQPTSTYFNTTREPISGSTNANPVAQIQNQFCANGGTQFDGGPTANGTGIGFFQPPVADRLVENAAYIVNKLPKFPKFTEALGAPERSARGFQARGDFDNGIAGTADGSYLNKPDDGNNFRQQASGALVPYFSQSQSQAAGGPTFFSPNRQVPGPGMFGSLPTRLRSGNQPFSSLSANTENTWRTLLLRPQSSHPGAGDPPDHLWLDFFWMPVVEPYAISEPFSTAGKINLNYAIEPFSYIRRTTGLVSLLRAEQMLAIPLAKASAYKAAISAAPSDHFRFSLDAHETLKQFDKVFDDGDVFRSATEICDIHLIPDGQSLNSDGSNADTVMDAFWQTNALTGDNSRERPYTNIQGRLTTKSNTYTVHYRVQSLKQTRRANPSDYATWDESKDTVSGELRGSTTLERYISPNDSRIPDYAQLYSANPNASPQDLGSFYKWRIVNTREFTP